MEAFRHEVLPQLNRLELLEVSSGYLPSSLPALRELQISCDGHRDCDVPQCAVRQYPRGITQLEVLCDHGCSVDDAVQGMTAAVKSGGLQLRELSFSALQQWHPCVLAEGGFHALEDRLEKLTLNVYQVRMPTYCSLFPDELPDPNVCLHAIVRLWLPAF
jgi:hypothetical protein